MTRARSRQVRKRYESQIVRPLCLGRLSSRYVRIFEAGEGALCRPVKAQTRQSGCRCGWRISEETRNQGFVTGLWCGYRMGMDLGDGIGRLEGDYTQIKDGMVLTPPPDHDVGPRGGVASGRHICSHRGWTAESFTNGLRIEVPCAGQLGSVEWTV